MPRKPHPKRRLHSKHSSNLINKKQNIIKSALIKASIRSINQNGGLSNQSLFTNQVLHALSLTSQSINQITSNEMIKRGAQKLLTHVLQGEQDKAYTMIKANPNLLTIKTTAKDYSFRTIIATPFQAALGAGDRPMWELMLPYLNNEEALKQFNEQFPNGIEEEISADSLKFDYNQLAQAIINDEDQGQSAIKVFREIITSQNEISQGRHFNLQHIIAAYQGYIDNFDDLASWDNRDKFWQQVIGYVQRQMTAYDSQVYCSGIKSVLNDNTTFSRDFSFINGGKLFPLSQDSGLGFDFGVFIHRNGALNPDWGGAPTPSFNTVLKKFIEQKQTSLQDLKSHLIQESVINQSNFCIFM